MKKLYILFIIAIGMTTVEATVTIKHTVKSGETLSGIAYKNRTSVAEIRQRSGLGKNKKLKLGTILTIAMNTFSSEGNKLSILRKKIQRKNVHTLDAARIARAKNNKPKIFVQKSKVQKKKQIVRQIKQKNTFSSEGNRLSILRKKIQRKNVHTLDAARIARAKNNKPKIFVQKSKAQKKKQIVRQIKQKNTFSSEGNRLSLLDKKIQRKNVHTLDAARIARAKNNKPKIFVQKKKKNVRIVTKKNKVQKRKKIVQQVKRKNIKMYAVQNGDTLFTIARKHKMTVATLLKSNKIKYQETLKLGQTLKVTRLSSKVVKKKKTLKIVKKRKRYTKEKKKLRTALTRYASPLKKQVTKKRNRVTVDDIFFKSSQPRTLLFSSSKKVKNIINVAKTKLGGRYVWGAVGKRGTFDCSGFTSYVFRKNGINIPRTSLNQSKYGKYITRANLKKGDLIFFDTSKRRKGYVNHVGIYLGNGQFIHASSAKKKVVVSSLSKFYSQRYKGARRPS